MTPEEARALFSEYQEGTLDGETKDRLQQFLTDNPDYAAEYIGFTRMLELMQRVPQREPVMDIWSEFAPKLAAYQAENKLGYRQRLHKGWHRFLSQVGAGLILYTQALAGRTHASFERYLLRDPVPRYDGNQSSEGM